MTDEPKPPKQGTPRGPLRHNPHRDRTDEEVIEYQRRQGKSQKVSSDKAPVIGKPEL